ncbi:dihydroorotate dehydrogenase electron transfer subunit [Salipaludibacillus agaradhaerens]|uniref:dihydroorotate dehydrogenase electron transfer subunit n=1 Tax=Salipaludibacillus agaradhaerens TaxID=76935 RepID=UPI002150BE8C|nr:dihydroorotate dehydrogenase electron transfer subunit [Salipaludibacillus agaradhaerens]MCR6107141.1 dihydroorotate dehydrogenase electron transfer subunit [Salipaludibacillus agaradhaerens]MCR6119171.1 dihydroorotate dehydrogenase electron transfer subunit [Salipaludibacillus agaradhaerens]UJW58216.1 dihydroorotate dehydrogenase electron transfer subunit [Bacillus sp. A116_S68]
MIVEDMSVIEQSLRAPGIYEMTLYGESVNMMTTPGQFLHIKVEEGISPLLRRPISICDVNLEKKELSIIYRVEGKGTTLLSRKKSGDMVNVLGPLGKGFPIHDEDEGKTALLIGGGVGIPPLYYLAKKLVEAGINVETVLGFRTAHDIFLEEEFALLGNLHISTEDGSKGTKGFVTTILEQSSFRYDTFYSCGPLPMLRAVEAATVTPGYVSLEERMGCGVGACLACVCDTIHAEEGSKDYRKVCSDGPVFRAGEVVL